MQGEAMIYVWLVQKYCILNSLHDGPSRIELVSPGTLVAVGSDCHAIFLAAVCASRRHQFGPNANQAIFFAAV